MGGKYIVMSRRTAIVLIPVKSVTVAEPPRINMELTIMFVARLEKSVSSLNLGLTLVGPLPKEHEDQMGNFAPSDTNDLQPRVGIRSIEF